MKAILVLDEMPNNCEECKIIYLQAHDERSSCDSGDWSKRPSWCPLRPLPSKDFWHKKDYADGWNDCLDAIEGETE